MDSSSVSLHFEYLIQFRLLYTEKLDRKKVWKFYLEIKCKTF